ncbi:glycosyltransferase family 4 protein [Anaerolineae bacterium CFX9]|nr:glycosyltransferase family 4 protein [Anaerolineae bacterium CFX9]
MPPKLFIASGIYPPESGGPATYLKELLPELHARGWEIRVLTYADQPAVSLEPYPVTRILRERLPVRLWRYARAARSLLEWADLVYQHTLGLPLIGSRTPPRVAKIVGDLAWERSIRRGWIAPTMDIDIFQTTRTTAQAEYAKVSRAREVRHLNGVIVPSQYLKRMVMGWGAAEAAIEVIYNALPPQNEALAISQAEARQQLDLPDAPMLLTVGRLVPWKGVDHLITALSRANVPDLRLIVAGDGDALPQLQAQAEALGMGGRVRFLGRVGREQMPIWMKAADYLALYSGYEGLSHTLLESLRVGTPVIASDKGGNPEVVHHGVNGLLVPYVDVDALTAALETAFQPGMRDRLAEHHALGMERFDFNTMIDHTERVLKTYL